MERSYGNEWNRRGKKYKAATLAALKQLYGGQNDKDCQTEEPEPNGGLRTDSVCGVAEEAGILGKR